MTQDQELSEILDDYYAPIVLPDINRNGLKRAIEAYVTTRVKEAERLARLEELEPVSFRIKDSLKPSSGSRCIVRMHLTDEFVDKRRAELKALTTTTNGKEE